MKKRLHGCLNKKESDILKIDRVRVGILRCNCYLLDIDNHVLVIDPGDEFDKIKKSIADRKVIGVIVTHHHGDHDGALYELVNNYHVKVYDRYNLNEGNNSIDKFNFEVIYTPGHKEDAITIYFRKENIMFCGDFIFKDSIGRCDLDGGNIHDMMVSIDKIKKYDKRIIIYPGHGISTTLGYEINNNPYFKELV